MSDMTTATTEQFEVSTNTATPEALATELTPTDPPATEADPGADASPDAATSDAARQLNVRKRSLEGRKQTIQDEINALVRQRGETQRERDQMRQELDALRAEKAALRPAPSTPALTGAAPASDPEPQEDDFQTYAEFVKATSLWTARQAVRDYEASQRQAQEQSRRQSWEADRTQSFAQRLSEAKTKHPDFDVLVNREDIELSPPMVEVIKDSPLAADLMLHFAAHPDDAQRLFALPPMLAFGEMKALEGRLSAASGGSAAPRRFSLAKPPITPVGSQPTATTDDPSDMEFGPEYVRRMNELDRSRRRW